MTPDFGLISGRRRLEAFRQLGRKRIPARIINYSQIDKELAHLEENLTQKALTVLERGQRSSRQKELYEARNPETRKGNNKERAVKRKNFTLLKPPFAQVAATASSVSTRHIQQQIKVVRDLAEDVQETIQHTKIADSAKELKQLPSFDHPTQ